MHDENNKKSILPHIIGAIGGVSSFVYGMKRDEALINKAIQSVEKPKEQDKIRKLVSQETKNPEYPYISAKLRGKLMKISNHSSILSPRMQSPLAFCVVGGLATFLGATALVGEISQQSRREI